MSQILLKSKLLMSFQEDVLNRNSTDWLMSHISFMLPLHKYKGEIILTNETLKIRYGTESEIILGKKDILDIYLGFDEVFHPGQDRSRGLSFQPLRIRYNNDKVIYLITDFNRLSRTSKNKVWNDTLISWLS